jgi:hypothetical protein
MARSVLFEAIFFYKALALILAVRRVNLERSPY